MIIAFRKHTLLPLDDCPHSLQPTITCLTRHRCLQRHGISRLPDVEANKLARQKFKTCRIGHFEIDMAEVHAAEGKLYLLVAVDRTSKFAFVQLHEKATSRVAGDFLRALVAAVPCKVDKMLTDSAKHFTNPAADG